MPWSSGKLPGIILNKFKKNKKILFFEPWHIIFSHVWKIVKGKSYSNFNLIAENQSQIMSLKILSLKN